MENIASISIDIIVTPLVVEATLLRSHNRMWSREEILTLTAALNSKVHSHPYYQAYIIIDGHHDEASVTKALGPKKFTLTKVTDPDELPFNPSQVEVMGN